MKTVAALLGTAALVVSPAAGSALGGPTSTPTPPMSLTITSCPALYALGVQGTGESSPDTAPSTDTGMLGLVFRPMMAAAANTDLVDRAYVPYPAAFGGAVGAAITPYAESVATGVAHLESMIRQVHSACPSTRIAIVAYSQGSHVASITAQAIGTGHGVVAPEVIAAVALMADPTRTPGAGLFPGTDATTPAPPPGTASGHLAELPAAPFRSAPSGGGIGPYRDIAEDFGALTGRVASLCVSGDLACDTPAGSAILRAAAGIASQSRLSAGDPIASLISIGQALAFTSLKAATTIAEQDVSGDSLATLSISPGKSISQRLAEASDPRTPLNVNAAVSAVMRVGTIALNAVNVVVASVLNPAALTQLATVALANPAAAVALLGEKFTSTINELVPPTTGDQLVHTAFEIVQREVADNRDLLELATWVRFWESATRHDAYSHPVGGGPSPAAWVGAWLAALAHDAESSLLTSAPASPSRTATSVRSSTADPATASPVMTTSTPGSVDLPAPTTSPGPRPSPVEVVGAPPRQLAAPPGPPIAPPVNTEAAPRQPGIHNDTAVEPTTTPARQPGVTDPTR